MHSCMSGPSMSRAPARSTARFGAEPARGSGLIPRYRRPGSGREADIVGPRRPRASGIPRESTALGGFSTCAVKKFVEDERARLRGPTERVAGAALAPRRVDLAEYVVEPRAAHRHEAAAGGDAERPSPEKAPPRRPSRPEDGRALGVPARRRASSSSPSGGRPLVGVDVHWEMVRMVTCF